MILCSKLKNGLCEIVTESQVVTKFNVTKLRLYCTDFSGGCTTPVKWLEKNILYSVYPT